MIRILVVLALSGVFAPNFLHAQRDWSQVNIETYEVNERLAYLTGSGGNVGVLYGTDGVVVIDDQYAPLSEKLKTAIEALTDSPVRFVVNSHYHGDHTGGNENFKNFGAWIVAHEKVRERLGITFQNAVFGRAVEAKSSAFWPVITFPTEMSFYLNGEEILLIHVPAAHTDGDALIYFKTSNVIHAGDVFVRYGYPFIDISAGGTIDGFIAANERILELADEQTQIIPGHGAIASEKEVEELLAMLRATRKIVADAKNSGQSLDQLIAAQPFAEFHDRWNGNFINTDLFVRLIYESLPD